MGTEVKSEVISYEARQSSGWRVNPLALDTKLPVLCIWWGDLPTKGFNTLLMTLAIPYVTEPLPETKGLRGLPVLWIFGNP